MVKGEFSFPEANAEKLKEMFKKLFFYVFATRDLIPFMIISGILSGIFPHRPESAACLPCIIAVIIGFSYKQILKAKYLTPEIFAEDSLFNTATIYIFDCRRPICSGISSAYERNPSFNWRSQSMLRHLRKNPLCVSLLVKHFIAFCWETVLDWN